MRILSLTLLAILMGCSATPDYDRFEGINHNKEETDLPDKIHRSPSMENTISWYEDERSGAAYNEKGYRYSLFDSRNIKRLDDHSVISSPEEVSSNAINSVFKSFSVYETSRWERFCGAGKMDIRDWDFIVKEGRDFVPVQLKNTCNAPAYTRQDYIAAWQASCNGGKPDSAELVIRKNTIRPPDVCNMTKFD